MQKCSIILPCYQEGKNIYKNTSTLYQHLKKKIPAASIEIILVNDGSHDNTEREIYKIQESIPGSIAISYKSNRWKWYAISKGLQKASGDIIWLFDSDGDIHMKFLVKYIKKLHTDSSIDIIIASKNVWWSKANVSIKRKILSSTNAKINSLLFNLPVTDTQVGLKVFRKCIQNVFLENVSTLWYAFDIDFLFHVHHEGYTIHEKAVRINIDDATSQVSVIKVLNFLREMFRLFLKVEYKIIQKKISWNTSCKVYILRSVIFPSEKMLYWLIYLLKMLKSNSK